MTTVAIIANPHAGKGRWRVARTAVLSEAGRIAQLRALVVGAAEGGADRVLLTRDPQGLSRRAVGGMASEVRVELLDVRGDFTGTDSSRAAHLMRDKGARAVVVVGGDGTIRDVCKGWRDAPIIGVAAGASSAFSERIDPTVAGLAAGVVARLPELPRNLVAHRAQTIHVDIDNVPPDLAVVTAAVLRSEPATSHIADVVAKMQTIVNAIAEPWSTGLSSIAGLVAPTSRTDDRSVLIELDPKAPRRVRAPLGPGEFHEVGLRSMTVLDAAQQVHVKGPAVLALDGDLVHRLEPGQRASLSVHRDGPRVIDVRRVYASAVRRGLFVQNPVQVVTP